MSAVESYCYPISPQKTSPNNLHRLDQPKPVPDPTPLTGFVNGKRASNLEERFARGLHSAKLSFIFQYKVPVAGTLPGKEKVVDFLVERGLRYPVEIDGLIAHHTTAQKGQDVVREILINHAFIQRGILPIRRVKWWQLETQEMANRVVRELFGGI
jgi:hypothetical protein